ncbi:MAG: UDP-glucose 4-epimerase GalE [Propionibacteriaceae bacterium]|jgi:UDP-glucose 4-epimerase|nr:UDP-glucose 4-epimerase GalE [Propionibacteriaceae bacterium]
MAVLLTGGTGFIGSHTAVGLVESGHEVVLLDNYANSRRDVPERVGRIVGRPVAAVEADLLDRAALDWVLADHGIDAVVHFAGFKAVGESVAKPLAYYHNNLVGTVNLLEAMAAHGVKRLVFSSSATVYRSDNPTPYREDYPVGATNPYGWTKVMIEQILRDQVTADPAWSVTLLRYFNPIGAHPSGLIGEDPEGLPNNLVPYVAQVAAGRLAELRVFGDDYDTPDGTGVRDYIHVMDLARGHVLALEQLPPAGQVAVFNLGTGRGSSVREVVAAYERASGRPIPTAVAPRRPGDLATVYADPARAARDLGFVTEFDLDAMCADSWRWQQFSGSLPERAS